MTEPFDVAVVGAGPAGCTAAGLLAKNGHRVIVVERERFPRYHIGESLVPGVRPVLEELELADRVECFGFTEKPGVTLRWGRQREPWTIMFNEVGGYPHAYQVVRSEFDYLLLQQARRLGAVAVEEATVREFLFEGDRCVGIRFERAGSPTEVRARCVVDASGQSAMLGRRNGSIEWDMELKNVAVWTYFQGARRLPGEIAGNILVENLPDGWLWVIPLHDGTHSVGWVTRAERAGGRGRFEDGLQRMIEDSDESSRLLAASRQVATFRTARDWSYQNRRFHGPGYLLAGDAAGFVDPVFSTGVFLAMAGASLAARAIHRSLEEPEREEFLFRRYTELYQDFLGVVVSFVHYFYDASLDKESYWGQAQRLIDPVQKMAARRDFIDLISGLYAVRKVMQFDGEQPPAETAGQPATTVRELFGRLAASAASRPEVMAGVSAVYQFDIRGDGGGRWFVDVADGRAAVHEGEAARADCTFVLDDRDYVAIATGGLSGYAAYLSGKLEVRGDLALAMKATALLDPSEEARATE